MRSYRAPHHPRGPLHQTLSAHQAQRAHLSTPKPPRHNPTPPTRAQNRPQNAPQSKPAAPQDACKTPATLARRPRTPALRRPRQRSGSPVPPTAHAEHRRSRTRTLRTKCARPLPTPRRGSASKPPGSRKHNHPLAAPSARLRADLICIAMQDTRGGDAGTLPHCRRSHAQASRHRRHAPRTVGRLAPSKEW